MASRAKRPRHKYSPIHMVTASTATAPTPVDSPTTLTAADKENLPPNLLPSFSHSQLYDNDSTQPSQPSPPPLKQPLPLQLPSPPRKVNSAFTPLTPFTPLSFRDIHPQRPVKPQQLFSTPQLHSLSQSLSQSQQQRPFRPITQPLPPNPLTVGFISFAASLPTSTPLRPTPRFNSPIRSSPPSVRREPPPAPSSYSTEKARFLRSLPHAHRYDAIVSTLEEEEHAATEWSESLTHDTPTTPPLSPTPTTHRTHYNGTPSTNHTDNAPTTPPSVNSLSSCSTASVGSFASPISAALSALMERDSGKGGRGVLEDDEILTPSPDVLPGSASVMGGVPSLPASIFSSVFSQRLPLPPLTAEAKQLMVESPLRSPPTAAARAGASPPCSATARTPPLPTLQPTAFTFAAPHLTASTSVPGEWKGVIHIDEDRLYNATPTQSSASCSPVSASAAYMSPSAFLSQASAASAASAASIAIPSSASAECDVALPQLEKVPACGDEEEQQQQQAVFLRAVESPPLPTTAGSSTEQMEVQPAADTPSTAEMEDVPAAAAERAKKGRRAPRTPVKSRAANGAELCAAGNGAGVELMGSAVQGKRRLSSRLRRSVDSLSPSSSSTSGDAVQPHDTFAFVGDEEAAASSEQQPKRRKSARVAAAGLSQPEESVPFAQPAAAAAADGPKKRKGRVSKSLTPPSSAATTAAPVSPTLSSTQPSLSLSQRSHRSSRSAANAAWQCGWCTWESPLAHMSCDMCSKARGSRPDAVVEVEVKVGGRKGRRTSKAVAASQSTATPPAAEEESQSSVESAIEASGPTSNSAGQPSETATPVSQQLLQTPNSSSSASSQLADTPSTSSTTLSQPFASPPPTHSPALSPATLLAEAAAEEDAEQAIAQQQQWTATQPAVSAAWMGSRGRRRGRLGGSVLSGGGVISATQAAEVDGEAQLDTTILHRRRRRRHW